MNNSVPFRTSTSIIVALAVIGHASANANEGRNSSARDLIEEVMVYGTKRTAAETAQGVPAQVAAFDNRQLEARQVINLEDLTMSTPNVALDTIGTVRGVANFSIRGQGINSSIPSIDPAVGAFVDGIYLGVTYGVITDLFDMESVEIHKGPQGVLFGRNVTGGAVLLRTSRPNGGAEFKGKIGVESGPQYTAAMSASGALVEDKVAAKVAVQYRNDRGYYENTTLGEDVGKDESIIIRPTVVFTPSETTEFTVIWERGDQTGQPLPTQDSSGQDPSNPSKDIATVSDQRGVSDIRWDQLTTELNWDVGTGQVTNIFGIRDTSIYGTTDVDGTPLALLNITNTTKHDQISNELRWAGSISENWDLTTGLFYFEADLSYIGGLSLSGGPNLSTGGVQKQKALGLFANNTYDINDTLTLQAGLRYSEDEKSVTIFPYTACDFDSTCGDGYSDQKKWTNWSPKIGLQYAVGEGANIYGHFARSYRAGGYNFRTPFKPPKSFDPERVDSFEVGIKSKTLDNRLRLNAAAYLNKINNMQREVNLPDPDLGIVQDIDNTASAEVKGFEIDTVFLATDALAITASVGYLDGDYTEILADLNGDGFIGGSDFDLSIPRLAKWTANLGVTYDIDLDEGNIILRADYAYRSAAAYTDNNRGHFNAYELVNAGITYADKSGHWEFAIYGKNLTNTLILGGVSVLSASLNPDGGVYYAPMAKGRRWGAELRFNF